MNVLKTQVLKHNDIVKYVLNIIRKQRCLPRHYTTTMNIEVFTNELLQRRREKMTSNNYILPDLRTVSFVKTKSDDITNLSDEDLDKNLQNLLINNKDKQIELMVADCLAIRRLLSDKILKTMLKHYANAGKPEMIGLISRYCAKLLPNMFQRNGEFIHYMAKAQCFKGNSEKGLILLKEGFSRYDKMRSFYKMIFKELIQDSVLNRSEASLVVFKKFVLEFSTAFEEHYPLVCLWHVCWLSSWYSDQVSADELWDASEKLREIVYEKVTALSISALKADYNEDAVVRLLQTLLKYKMMEEYLKVLQVLFSYKLRRRDLRGCSEIIRNCEVLGLTLPSKQQGKFIKMLIGRSDAPAPEKPPSKDFPLKF